MEKQFYSALTQHFFVMMSAKVYKFGLVPKRKTDYNKGVMQTIDNFKHRNIEMLVLFMLEEDEYYGYRLSTELTKRSGNIFVIQEGTLYPALYRLLDRGYINSRYERITGHRSRVYYRITPSGSEYLKSLIDDFDLTCNGIKNVFESRTD